MNHTARLLTWFLINFAQTVPLANIDNALHSELVRRARYAIRFGIHAPDRFDVRYALLIIAIGAILLLLGFLAL
jgi:hypothetical protein